MITSARPSSPSRTLRPTALVVLVGTAACFNPESVATESGTTFGPPPGSTGPVEDSTTTTTGEVPTGEAEGTSSGSGEDTVALDSSSSGGAAECGNGVVEGDEECDEGAGNGDTQACTNGCRNAVCGDGLVWAGEEGCDDAGESPMCDADCTPAACGDGTVNPTAGEQCEADGPGFDCSACLGTCLDGFDDCNGDLLGDGCETDLTDPATCGDCMTTCGMGEDCINGNCLDPSAAFFLFTERNSPNVWEWDPLTEMTVLYHETTANDADCNAGQGSASAWVGEHFSDYFASFTPGTGMGIDMQFGTPYAYPKHVTVFDNQIVVMSRNDATIHWYSFMGMSQGSQPTGNGTGQGMATDGASLWASFWDGATSHFVRYDATFTAQEMIANPMGLMFNNVVDFAWDPATGDFYGLVTDGEGGTGTQSNTVVRFEMGGMVLQTYMLPFFADGIGQQLCP